MVLFILMACLQPPFNVEARAAAGFTSSWYLPLASQLKTP